MKNNLQVVSSLLNIQLNTFKDKKVQNAFENCRNRIAAMANVHEILYRTSNFSSINFSTYITTLIRNLKKSYKLENSIKFHLNLINIFLKVDIAIPLGMAINEIVINSLKHAKVGEERLEIYLDFQVQSGSYCLNIGDNGRGMTSNKLKVEESIGLELLKLFCDQVSAEIILLERKPGVHYSICFDK